MASIAQLKERIDLREVVAETRDVQTRGDSVVALCPFHNDTTPSMHVKADYYHCFACNERGDVINWLQHEHGYDLQGAIEEAHDIAGLPFYSRVSSDASFGMAPAPSFQERLEKCQKCMNFDELFMQLCKNRLGNLARYADIGIRIRPTDTIRFICDWFSVPYTWEGKLWALRAYESIVEEHHVDI